MKHPKKLTIFTVMIGLLVMVATAWGLQPFTLPDFQLIDIDGKAVNSGDLTMTAHWVVIYVDPRNQFSNQFLWQFAQDQNPPSRTVVIVAGGLDDAKAMQSRHPYLSQASWYADPSGTGFKALKLHGAPVVLGVNGKIIQWNINGSFPDSAVQKSIVNAWLH